jgi:hypothetical protein
MSEDIRVACFCRMQNCAVAKQPFLPNSGLQSLKLKNFRKVMPFAFRVMASGLGLKRN